jgi:hypothetical protein
MKDALAGIGAIGGIIGAVAGIGSAVFAGMEWRKVNRKIAMVGDMSRAAEILPAWYTSRMMSDQWCFGLWVVSGQMIAITSIKSLSDNGEWMDVELAEASDLPKPYTDNADVIVAVAADRTKASIKIANIVAATDLWTS